MAFIHSPKLVTSGLIFCLDAANKVSYPGSGASLYDLISNTNTGTLTNGSVFNNINNGVIVFDGVDDYAVTGNIDVSNTNVISVDMWVKILNYKQVAGTANILLEFSSNFNSVTTGFVVAFADDSNPVFGGTYPISTGVRGNIGYNVNYWDKTLVNDLNWHHWCCVFDKSQTTQETFLYIDGIFRTGNNTSLASNNTNNFGNLPLYFAGRVATLNSNVQLSNIKVYNRILSATEVLQNYNANRSRFLV